MTTRAQGQSGLQPSPVISEPCDIGQTVLFLSPLDAPVWGSGDIGSACEFEVSLLHQFFRGPRSRTWFLRTSDYSITHCGGCVNFPSCSSTHLLLFSELKFRWWVSSWKGTGRGVFYCDPGEDVTVMWCSTRFLLFSLDLHSSMLGVLFFYEAYAFHVFLICWSLLTDTIWNLYMPFFSLLKLEIVSYLSVFHYYIISGFFCTVLWIH